MPNFSVKFMKHHLLVTLGFTNSTHTFNDTSLEIISNVMSLNSPAPALNVKLPSLAITFHLEPSCHFSLLKNHGKMFPWISLFTSCNHRYLMLSLSLLIVSPKWHTLSLLKHRSTHLELAQLFLDNIVHLHGFPRSIVSDRDPRFLSHFWRKVFSLTETTLRFSTANHPQTDGQTERTNRTLEQYLRIYACHNPSSWSKYLTTAEIAS